MNTKNPIEADAKLIIDMYDYALTHKLDISSKTDIATILKMLGQKNVSEDRIGRLMAVLAVTDKRIRKDVEKRTKKVN